MRRSAKERSWRKPQKPHGGGLNVRAFQQAGIPGHAYIGGVGHKRPYKRCRGYHMRRLTAGQIAGTRNTALASIRNSSSVKYTRPRSSKGVCLRPTTLRPTAKTRL